VTCYPESVNYVGFGDAPARYGQSGGGRSGPAAQSIPWLLSVFALLLVTGSAPAAATTYPLATPDTAVVGEDQTVQTVYEDTLYDLARKFSLGSEEVIRVNPGWIRGCPGPANRSSFRAGISCRRGRTRASSSICPSTGSTTTPSRKRGQPAAGHHYPVSIGKMDWHTPIGVTHVIAKEKNPVWFPPESVRKEHAAAGDPLPTRVPSGPDNPLGLFAMRLAAGNGTYMIHGTNNPIAVGMPVTHGCIRMYPEDVEQLFPMIAVGTPVRIINEPVKVAWVDGELLLEAHPPVDAEGQSFEPDVDQFAELLRAAVGRQHGRHSLGLRARSTAKGRWRAGNGRPGSRCFGTYKRRQRHAIVVVRLAYVRPPKSRL
jgi:L,D-transpeptidase ErfK/SrfK